MECELCGKESNKLREAIIEGIPLLLCENCIKFGKVKKEKINFIKYKDINKKEKNIIREVREKELMIKPNAGEIIKKYRERERLTRKELALKLQVKEKLIERLEKGELNLDINDVKKIEKKIGISLIEEVVIDYKEKDSKGEEIYLTVGDIIKIK